MLWKFKRLINVKTPEELESMARAGRLAAECLEWIINQVEPGMSTLDIDDLQTAFASKHKVIPAPLNYNGFPKSICTSINQVICHGIPNANDILKEGDIIGIDVTLIVDGYHGDTASTIPVGTVAPEVMKLLSDTLECNRLGIRAVREGGHVGDIGAAIQAFAEPIGYSVVREFVGHGIGKVFHEQPHIPHCGKRGRGPSLASGMTFTVEPMINQGAPTCIILDDDWTVITSDGKLSAQYEHTLAVTPEGYRVLTVQNDDGLWEPPGRWTPPGFAD
jgi:methionyl aminopeptidase